MTDSGEDRQGRRKFLLTCLLRGMTVKAGLKVGDIFVSTHMPLARHDQILSTANKFIVVSTHMPLARHDCITPDILAQLGVSTHMPLARHDSTIHRRHPASKFLLTCLLRGMT